MILIAIFNVCFIAPLLAMIAVLTFAGPDAYRLLARTRRGSSAAGRWCWRCWP